MSGEPDPYEVLQVRPDAGEDVIRAAYRALARRHHPDMASGAASAAQMVIVNWAYEILGDGARREHYDREHGIVPRWASPTKTPVPPASWSGRGPVAGADAGGNHGAAGQGAGPAGPGQDAGGAGVRSPSGRPPVQRRGPDGRVIEWRNAPDGTGGAGEPPGPPSGSILSFGRFIAWSIGEIANSDPGYLEWLDGRPEGAPYRDEIDATLKRRGWRQAPASSGRRTPWGQ